MYHKDYPTSLHYRWSGKNAACSTVYKYTRELWCSSLRVNQRTQYRVRIQNVTRSLSSLSRISIHHTQVSTGGFHQWAEVLISPEPSVNRSVYCTQSLNKINTLPAQSGYICLCVGRFVQVKRFDLLLDVLAENLWHFAERHALCLLLISAPRGHDHEVQQGLFNSIAFLFHLLDQERTSFVKKRSSGPPVCTKHQPCSSRKAFASCKDHQKPFPPCQIFRNRMIRASVHWRGR